MNLELQCPKGLDDGNWTSIQDNLERLQYAVVRQDRRLIIGTAKELVEATSRVVLETRGEPTASGEDYEKVVVNAHKALDRHPGHGQAAHGETCTIAQSAKTIALQLRPLRNNYGTGHGHALIPNVTDEMAFVALDAAMLWTRWALRRLGHLITNTPAALISELRGDIFTRGELTQRLTDAELPLLDLADQRRIGVAVARRAMRDTVNVMEEGVNSCAASDDLRAWPPGYREGLAEGLFFTEQGYLAPSSWGVERAALVLAAHPDLVTVLRALAEKIPNASYSYKFANDPTGQQQVVDTMKRMISTLPDKGIPPWRDLTAHLDAGTSTHHPPS